MSTTISSRPFLSCSPRSSSFDCSVSSDWRFSPSLAMCSARPLAVAPWAEARLVTASEMLASFSLTCANTALKSGVLREAAIFRTT
eukprot:71123-Prymnesium_polylepis.1